jgi:hypothetical protein
MEKSGVFYPYYTVEYMQGRVKKATQKAIRQQSVQPQWDKLSPSQQESIRSLLDRIGIWASIMAPATPFCFWTTHKHLTVKRTMGSRA